MAHGMILISVVVCPCLNVLYTACTVIVYSAIYLENEVINFASALTDAPFFHCMKREILLTEDGSATIAVASTKMTFHSINGAIQESMHVFIETGLKPLLESGQRVSI